MITPFLKKFKGFVAKYDFPAHLHVVLEILISRLSMTCWTVWTKLYLRSMRCPFGRGLCIHGRPWIKVARKGALRLGRDVSINSRTRSNPVGLDRPAIIDCIGGGQVEIGDGSGLSSPVISSRASITLGRHVLVGGNVRIFDHDFHDLIAPAGPGIHRGDGTEHARPVVIGDDVFVGVNAILLKGTTLGDGTVVGAGAVVAGLTVPPGSVVYGNPARVKTRRVPPPGAGQQGKKGDEA